MLTKIDPDRSQLVRNTIAGFSAGIVGTCAICALPIGLDDQAKIITGIFLTAASTVISAYKTQYLTISEKLPTILGTCLVAGMLFSTVMQIEFQMPDNALPRLQQ